MKKSKKPSEKKAATSKLGRVLKQHPVVYISETGNGRIHNYMFSAIVGWIMLQVGWIV